MEETTLVCGKLKFMIFFIRYGLHQALKGKATLVFRKEPNATTKIDDGEYDDLDLKEANMICLCLVNVHEISTTKELREKLEQLYQGEGILNLLHINESFILFV